MKMTPGTGTILDYASFIANCTLGQKNYRVPVNFLSDVQLYIDIGPTKPGTVLAEMISTCQASYQDVTTLTVGAYVIGQDPANNWYGVFKDLQVQNIKEYTCFVIAITLDDQIYFSQEYCIETNCAPLTLLKGCYGNLDPKLSTDCEGIYFGVHAGTGTALGDATVTYEHKLLIRDAEISLAAIKNSFKQGRTRTFRTEKQKLFEFTAELVPEWYIPDIDAIFYRGEVFINGVKYLVAETQFEKIEDCKRIWKPVVSLKENCLQSFSCVVDACTPVPEECCEPVFINASVEEIIIQSGGLPNLFPPPLEDDILDSGKFISEAERNIIVVQCNVDALPVVTGTLSPVMGLTDGSSTVSCSRFAGQRVVVERGHIPLPGIDPGDGGAYYTKAIESTDITFNMPLATGEFIYIETIPTYE